MNPLTVLGNLIGSVTNYLQQQRVYNTIDAAFNTINAVQVWLARTIEAIAQYQGQEQGAVQFSAQYARQIGHDFEEIEGYQIERWTRLLQVILPNSINYAVGYVYSDGVIPLRHAVGGLTQSLKLAWQDISKLDNWRTLTADPELSSLVAFQDMVTKNYLPAVDVLRDWLANPAHFGNWAAPPLIGPIIVYLANPQHQGSRDNFTLVLGGAWSEVAEATWTDIENMLVAST